MSAQAPLSFEVKFSVIVGLVLVALVHSASGAYFQRVLPPIDPCACANCSGAPASPRGGLNVDNIDIQSIGGPSKLTLPVSERARSEVKQAGTPQPAPAAKEAPCLNCPRPAAQVPITNTRPVATTARYNLAIFVVHSDPTSQRLLNWFNSDPQLQALKSQCNFQVYTPDNAIYKSRYAKDVPVDSFPAVVYSDPSGGLVHAAGPGLMPNTATDLASDLTRAQSLQRQVVAAAKQQAPPQVDIPTLQGGCDGDSCDRNRDPFFNPDRAPIIPRDNVQPRSLFDIVVNTEQGRSWILIAVVGAGIVYLVTRK